MPACILGNGGEVFFPKLGEDQMLTFSFICYKFVAAQDISYYIVRKRKIFCGLDRKSARRGGMSKERIIIPKESNIIHGESLFL